MTGASESHRCTWQHVLGSKVVNDDSTSLHHSFCGKGNIVHIRTVEGTRLLPKHWHGAIIEDNDGRTPLQLALEHLVLKNPPCHYLFCHFSPPVSHVTNKLLAPLANY
jgi:hypothetical protein